MATTNTTTPTSGGEPILKRDFEKPETLETETPETKMVAVKPEEMVPNKVAIFMMTGFHGGEKNKDGKALPETTQFKKLSFKKAARYAGEISASYVAYLGKGGEILLRDKSISYNADLSDAAKADLLASLDGETFKFHEIKQDGDAQMSWFIIDMHRAKALSHGTKFDNSDVSAESPKGK